MYYNVDQCKKYIKEHSKYDSVDNNIAESFNSWILSVRYKTLITMLGKDQGKDDEKNWSIKRVLKHMGH